MKLVTQLLKNSRAPPIQCAITAESLLPSFHRGPQNIDLNIFKGIIVIFLARPITLAQCLQLFASDMQDLNFTHGLSEAGMQTYAWLEFYRGMWHLLTNLLADPENATRSWTDGQEALQELAAEGWILMLPYPRVSHTEDSGANTTGYGLTRYGSIN